jgi:hypothetical protein
MSHYNRCRTAPTLEAIAPCQVGVTRSGPAYNVEMKLADALKTSLDELRMQMLGTQVLLGLQFQGLFQENFATVGVAGRTLDAVGMMFLMAALALRRLYRGAK